MAYNWAQLAFVEKWRLSSVRGVVVGMHRPADRTFFDLRLYPGEGGVGPIPGPLDLHLVDVGNLIREKRVTLMDRLTVVIRAATSLARPPESPVRRSDEVHPRRRLESGSRLSGKVLKTETDVALVDVGLPLIVQLHEGSEDRFMPGQSVELSLSETPQGFLVL